ncbi:rab3 GTPase-activating protein non-catalytic subunit-like [Ptychodera flava]|uniref:rab3 GTPase-activating protein non-catalytic subunit-like n=1 Tax=Ptychodera flava TaxID=63121 RepID=UPI00396A4A09
MSCSLTNFGRIQDIDAVKRFLFPNIEGDLASSATSSDGWDDADWKWQEDDFEVNDKEETDGKKAQEKSWFQDCCISLSPTHDILVITYEEKAVFLTQKWDEEEESGTGYKYHISFKRNFNTIEGEHISSVMCVPLASQKRSSQGGPDWTCIMIGLTSGYVHMYTESGCLLISQLLHEEPVLKLKCRTYEIPRHSGVAEQMEELTILYPTVLVTIDGFSLFQSLRACRNQVARAAASGSDCIQPPPLAYKKWNLQDQEKKNDIVSTGVTTPCSFDQMSTASILGGYNATVKPSPPASSKYVTSGYAPYVGFYFALEGSVQPLMSDVALAVASKLKTALFTAASGWFGFKSSGEDQSNGSKRKPKVEPANSLGIRFGLPDLRRHGNSITLSPSRTLAVTNDSFGRVILIDVTRGVAIRVWKGYRDAQCGWIQVTETERDKTETPNKKGSWQTKSKGPSRSAVFLVIYAPRRGILEVWNIQQGPRVAAFNVDKSCRLVCPGYYIMGLNSTTAKTAHPPSFQSCLLQPDGFIKTITIPFHLALSDKNSKRARDIHLLKKITLSLQTADTQNGQWEESIMQTLLNMKIPSLKQQALEKTLHAKGLNSSFLTKVVTEIADQICSQDIQYRSYESKRLLHYCNVQLQLLYAYTAIKKVNEINGSAISEDDGARQSIEQVLMSVLTITKTEVEDLLNLLNDYQQVHSTRVHFQPDFMINTSSFIKCFDVDCYNHNEIDKHSEEQTRNLSTLIQTHLHGSLSDEQTLRLGGFMFKSILAGSSSINDFSVALKSIGLAPQVLMSVLLQLWLSSEELLQNLTSLCNLKDLMIEISQIVERNESVPTADTLSPWWQMVRDTLSKTTSVCTGLTAAMVARSVAMAMRLPMQGTDSKQIQEKFQEEDTEKDIDDTEMEKVSIDKSSESLISEEWVSVSLDIEQWNLLVDQLQDITAISCLLMVKPTKLPASTETAASKAWSSSQDSTLYTAIENLQNIEVSVDKMLHGGRGIVSEIIAKWVAKYGIPPSMLADSSPSVQEVYEDTINKEEKDRIYGSLSALRMRFPSSLEPDVLYSHSTWQYIVMWNKTPEVSQYLQQALFHLSFIKNTVLQHGICYMMWHTFLVKKVSAAAYLMEKVGKAPKDRLCRKDIGMSEIALGQFLDLACETLLKLYQIEVEASAVPAFSIEDTWQKISGPTSIAELAIDQPQCNYPLVDLHRQLCTIMHAVMVFGMRSVKPMSLFDSKGRNALFKDLSSNPQLPTHEIDVKLLSARQQILCRIISSAVSSLPITANANTTHMAMEWPNKVLQLGLSLDVDVDVLKRHYVCQLYGSGYDAMAQEVLVTVHEHAEMGSQLLDVVGQRLSHVVVNPDASSLGKLSRLPPSLISWIKSLNAVDLRNRKTPLQDTAILIGHIVNQLPEDHVQYSLAIQLVEAVDALM